ncbi:unnamed protein product [Rhizoctonia solani]|uniref:Uncharacterized protein n=1 Tax=Rhizoctonia solani TaxID=456999 RepID=A0A8H3HBG2_9AGAM|nr:unnamed protein product [Rhizoctonia solani]
MVAATGLTTPLDQWVCAKARTARLEMLLRSHGSGAQKDYTNLNIDDALPLLSHACKTSFGDLTALEFSMRSSQGPLAYSAVLTITGPDEIGIEFPNSGNHATQLQAKMHAAYKAILGGAIGYITQSAGPITPELNEFPIDTPASPKHTPRRVHQNTYSDTANSVTRSLKQGKKPRGVRAKTAPDALNLINTFLQRVYHDHKTTMPKSSQEWEVVYYGGGTTARLTIRLPSGSSRSYGDLPGRPSEPGKVPKIYPSAAAAKKDVANGALKAGVLEFIKFDKPEGTTLSQPTSPTVTKVPARDPLSRYVAYDPSMAVPATGANSIPIAGIASTSANSLPSPPPLSEFVSEESTPTQNVGPVPPLEQVLSFAEDIPRHTTPLHLNQSPSPIDDMEVVDELLGPASFSNTESDEHEEEEEVDELNSSECGNDGALSEGRSEPMELDSETGTPPKEISVNHPGNKVSPPRDDPEPGDEPSHKKQRTEPPESPIEEPNQKPNQELDRQEPKAMVGTSYSNILSEFCFEHGHAQPQVTYQRNFEHSKAEGPVMYNVSISLGASRFELSKQYESIELAEEKLSKRILRQFGIRAKKI